MLDILPIILWVVAAVWMFAVCAVCAVRGKLFARGDVHVDLVHWSVIAAQLVSVILTMVPFIVYRANEESFSAWARGFYEAAMWPALIVLVVLIAAELALMYVQARRATRTQMDEALSER